MSNIMAKCTQSDAAPVSVLAPRRFVLEEHGANDPKTDSITSDQFFRL